MKYLIILLTFLSYNCVIHETIIDCTKYSDSEKNDITNIVKYMNDNSHKIDLVQFKLKEKNHNDSIRLHLVNIKHRFNLKVEEFYINGNYYLNRIWVFKRNFQRNIYESNIESKIITTKNAIYKGFKSKQNYSYYVCLKDEKFIKIWVINPANTSMHTINLNI